MTQKSVLKIASRFCLATVWSLLCLGMSPAWADGGACKDVFADSTSDHPTPPPLDAAKEIELARTIATTALLIASHERAIDVLAPVDREVFFKHFFPKLPEQNWSQIKFAELSLEQSEGLIYLAGRHVDYYKSRAIPGFEFAQEAVFVPQSTFFFRGETFYQGEEARVSLKGFLLPLAEYATPNAVPNAAVVEMHFRGENPDTLDRDVRIFYREILPNLTQLAKRDEKVSPMGDHVHVPARRPTRFIERMRAKGLSDRQIATLLATYHSIVETNSLFVTASKVAMGAIAEKFSTVTGAPPLISFLQAEKMTELVNFYEAVVQGRELEVNKYGETATALKKNHVGARWGATYTDKSLFGMEFRSVSYEMGKDIAKIATIVKEVLDGELFNFSDAEVTEILSQMQSGVLDYHLMISKDVITNISAIKDPKLQDLARLFYVQHGAAFGKEVLPRLKEYPPAIFLLFDWSLHPLISRHPGLIAKIKAAQMTYLYQALPGGVHHFAFDDFLKDSGLGVAFEQMLRGGHLTDTQPAQQVQPKQAAQTVSPVRSAAPVQTVPAPTPVKPNGPTAAAVTSFQSLLGADFTVPAEFNLVLDASISSATYATKTITVTAKASRDGHFLTEKERQATAAFEFMRLVFVSTAAKSFPQWKLYTDVVSLPAHEQKQFDERAKVDSEFKKEYLVMQNRAILSRPYQILMGDLAGIILTKEPNIFEGLTGSVDRAFEAAGRNFPAKDDSKNELFNDLGPTRKFLYANYFSKSKSPEQSAKMLRVVLDAVLAEVQSYDLTSPYYNEASTAARKIHQGQYTYPARPSEMNAKLIRRLKATLKGFES